MQKTQLARITSKKIVLATFIFLIFRSNLSLFGLWKEKDTMFLFSLKTKELENNRSVAMAGGGEWIIFILSY